MNNKEQQPEPLAAILAEMRRDGANSPRVLALADRIEAAANLEYEEAKNYFAKLHDGPSMICTAKNCAARNIGLSLAAPARNCDRFATVDEARKAFQEARGHKVLADVELWDSMDEAGALVRWLFDKAKGGAE